jgi:hypothetical protein
MGQLAPPHLAVRLIVVYESHLAVHRDVAAQVEFERHTLKPGLIFKGIKGLKPVAFNLWFHIVQLAPLHRDEDVLPAA